MPGEQKRKQKTLLVLFAVDKAEQVYQVSVISHHSRARCCVLSGVVSPQFGDEGLLQALVEPAGGRVSGTPCGMHVTLHISQTDTTEGGPGDIKIHRRRQFGRRANCAQHKIAVEFTPVTYC